MSLYRTPRWTMTNAFSTLEQVLDWPIAMVRAPDAWKKTRGTWRKQDGTIGRVKILVIDTGTKTDLATGRANHPDLVGAYIGGRNFTDSPYGLDDRNGHGTATSALICANNNETGIVGIASEADVWIAKALGDDGSGLNSWIAAAVRWGDELDVDIISFSGGSPAPDPELWAAIDQFLGRRKQRFFIAAAGNDGTDNSVDFPASHPQVLAVASVNKSGVTSRFSSRGDEVDCAVPGEGVRSCNRDGDYGLFNGTSFACPIAAGIVALALAWHRDELVAHRSPLDTFDDLIAHISQAAKASEDPMGQGHGFLLADQMLPNETEPDTKPIYSVDVGPFVWSMPAKAGDLASIGLKADATPEVRAAATNSITGMLNGLALAAVAPTQPNLSPVVEG
jgi:hypothetical protein